MGRPRQFTDEEILDATQACILANGPSVSTTMIAERLQMSQAALFKRFGTKEKLIIAALSRPMLRNPIAEIMGVGPSKEPIRDQMIAMGTAILMVMRRVVPCMSMLHAAGIDPTQLHGENSPPIQGRKYLTQWFQAVIDQGRVQQVFDPHVMAVGFLGMLHARPFRETILGDTALECTDLEYVTQLVGLLWTGIGLEEGA